MQTMECYSSEILISTIELHVNNYLILLLNIVILKSGLEKPLITLEEEIKTWRLNLDLKIVQIWTGSINLILNFAHI